MFTMWKEYHEQVGKPGVKWFKKHWTGFIAWYAIMYAVIVFVSVAFHDKRNVITREWIPECIDAIKEKVKSVLKKKGELK